MAIAFEFFDKDSDVVVGNTGKRPTHGSGHYFERLLLAHSCALGERYSKAFIYHRFERPPGSLRLRLQSSRDVIIQSKSSSHTS